MLSFPDLVVDDSGGKAGTRRHDARASLPSAKNHGDNSLIMRLPKEKIIFVVDFLPLSGTQFRQMADTYLPVQEITMKKILAMDWDKLIPGAPEPADDAPAGRNQGRRQGRP